MGRVRRSQQPGPDRSEWSQRGYLSAVWYLRAVAVINFLGAMWVSLGNDIQRHDDELFTLYLLTAGVFSGVLSMFLAITMRRRKCAAWILNLVLTGLTLVLTALALELPVYRQHVQNWIAVLLTAFFVTAMIAGRREFHAKGDHTNPKLAEVVGVVGLVGSLLATTVVIVSNTGPEAWPGSIDPWLVRAGEHGWTPSVIGGQRRGRHHLRPARIERSGTGRRGDCRHQRVHCGRPFHAECPPGTPPCRARRVHRSCQPSRGHVGGRDCRGDRVDR